MVPGVMPSLGCAHSDDGGVLGHGRIGGLRATVALEAFGSRSQGLRGFVRPNFRVAVPGVSGVSNPGLLIWLKALDMGGTCETC